MKRYMASELSCVRRLFEGIPSSCGCRKRNRECKCTAPQEEDYSKENYVPKIESPYNLYEGQPGGCALLFFRNVKPIIDWDAYYKKGWGRHCPGLGKKIFYAEKKLFFVDLKGNTVNEEAWYVSEIQEINFYEPLKGILSYYFNTYPPSHNLWRYALKMNEIMEKLEHLEQIFSIWEEDKSSFLSHLKYKDYTSEQ